MVVGGIPVKKKNTFITMISSLMVVLTVFPAFALDPGALPTGGRVTAGSGSITQSGSAMTINQQTARMVADWSTFNIGRNASVTFDQPSASSVALNRIFDQNPSQIFGSLRANGQIFLMNPQGIYFGPGATVDVGGLVASTLRISNASFLSGDYTFFGKGAGSIVNQGTINAADYGYVAFISPVISNQGTITATSGTVAMAAGDKVSLDFTGDRLVGFTVDKGTVDALIENQGLIQADGGMVMMTAKAARTLTDAVINNSGIIEARTLDNVSGRILLVSDKESGRTVVGGTLDASAPNGGDGGSIETSAANVTIKDGAVITTAAPFGKAGTWLIDPNDFTIAASGGDVTGAALTSALTLNSVTIQTTLGAATCTGVICGPGTSGHGDIFVNDSVTWSAKTLTLNAYRDITINSPLYGSGTAQLSLLYGQGASNGVIGGTTATYTVNAPVNLPSGNNFSTQLGSGGALKTYYVIDSLGSAGSTTGTDLQGINGSLSGNYALGANIDASATSGWNSGAGFNPIGNASTNFTGIFDGLGHTITNLTINRPSTDYVGLFGFVHTGASIDNVEVGGSVTGQNNVGSLVGRSAGTITNSYSTAAVTGSAGTGGLVGYNTGKVTQSYATGTVTGANYTGGLVGLNTGTGGAIGNSYATGTVTGAADTGGLVGYSNASITNSYATGTVTGATDTGGLVGYNNASITNSYATGAVYGATDTGGLVGYSNASITTSYATGAVYGATDTGGLVGYSNVSITNSYATGAVYGASSTGGLVGDNEGAITTSYASGAVSGAAGSTGGLVAYNSGTVNNSFWDIDTTGQTTSAGGTGYHTPDLFKEATYTGAGWDFGSTWYMIDGQTRPFLQMEYSTSIHNSHQLQLMAMNLSASYTLANDIDMSELTQAAGHWKTSSYPASSSTQLGFVPVGTSSAPFTGALNGNGETINNMYIDRPNTDYVGLFGYLGAAGTVTNVGLMGGSVTGQSYVGALAGYNNGEITNSYATGAVTGGSYTGGLVGDNEGTISTSYASGAVNDTGSFTGGLVGYNAGMISDSYATGSVTGITYTGGLVGYNDASGTIINTYAAGAVNGTGGSTGGLVGDSAGSVTGSFWDTGTTGQLTSAGGPEAVPKTTDQLVQQTTYTPAGWNFGSTWYMIDGQTRPFLQMEWSTSIHNSHQLQLMAMNLGASYTLANDIDMSELALGSGHWLTLQAGGEGGFVPVGNSLTPFTGALNGNGYVINGLFIDRPLTYYVGLFGYLGSSASISNVGMEGSTLYGAYYIGALAGYNQGGTITNSYASDDVMYGSGYVGGLVGYNAGTITNSYATGLLLAYLNYSGGLTGYNTGTITHSYSALSLSSTGHYAGGLVGENDGTITDAYATGPVVYAYGADSIGGLVGYNTGTITDAYATGLVTVTASVTGPTGATNVGGLVGQNTGAVNNSFWDIDTTGQTASAGGTGAHTPDLFKEATYTNAGWDFGSTWYMIDGETRPFLQMEYSTSIHNSHQLQLMAMNLGASYTLANDIDMSELADASGHWKTSSYPASSSTELGFVPVGNASTPFTGAFNGNGYIIDGIYINRPNTEYVGLFGNVGASGIVSNVGIAAASVTGQYDVGALAGYSNGLIANSYAAGAVTGANSIGGLVGYNDASGAITGSWATGAVTGSGGYTGGLAGYNDGFVTNSYAVGAVTGSGSYTGGLVGYNDASGFITGSWATGAVTGSGSTGGLVGYSNGTITNSYATGAVTGSGSYTGGLVGYNDTYGGITNSYATGSVSGAADTGGLAGYNNASITNSYATGAVTGSGSYTGGLVGYNDASGGITNSYATGAVSGAADTGGLAGYNYGSIGTSYATGAVTGSGSSTGGLVGYNDASGSITGSWATGAVTGSAADTGGLAGYNNGSIGTSYATGAVTGSGSSTGGLVGYNDASGSISTSYASGAVTGSGSSTGGLVGDNEGSITNACATGSVSGTADTGGLVGYNGSAGTVNNTYATGSVSGTAGSTGGLVGQSAGGALSPPVSGTSTQRDRPHRQAERATIPPTCSRKQRTRAQGGISSARGT
jgi:filamentous hemagglutinin family protein